MWLSQHRAPPHFTIGHNVRNKEEMDEVMQQAKTAGAKITKAAADRFWGGYAGYFQDPDGNLRRSPGTRKCCRKNKGLKRASCLNSQFKKEVSSRSSL